MFQGIGIPTAPRITPRGGSSPITLRSSQQDQDAMDLVLKFFDWAADQPNMRSTSDKQILSSISDKFFYEGYHLSYIANIGHKEWLTLGLRGGFRQRIRDLCRTYQKEGART